ncbi:MAG: SCO family protein [Rhizomicrobium sp.]
MLRTPIALIPYLVLCACVALGALWNMADNGSSPSAIVAAGTLGGPFALTDQGGQARTDKDFRGGFVLLYFGYSNCPDVCPTTLASMADALDKMGAKSARITPVFITIDPARDTPRVLKLYLAAFGPRFVGLTGSDAAIARVAGEYRVYLAKRPLKGGGYAMDHSGQVYLLGPDGRLVTFYDAPLDSKALAADLEKRL